MPTETLLEKAYGAFSPQDIEHRLLSLCQGLRVKVGFQGITERNWVKVEITGEDQTVALRLLDREIGLAPAFPDKVRKFSVLRGKVIDSGKNALELRVDVGVFSPMVYDATISLQSLQAQLADGKKLPLKRLIELFCLYDYFPLSVKIVGSLNTDKGVWRAELSEMQLSLFGEWIRSSVDRLIVLGAPLRDIEHAVEASEHHRDIMKIESLGLLEHAIQCKLGTDAVGLMPKLGPYLKAAHLVPFSPRKIKQIIDRICFEHKRQ